MTKQEIRSLYISTLRDSVSVKSFLESHSQVAEFYDAENEIIILDVVREVDDLLQTLQEW